MSTSAPSDLWPNHGGVSRSILLVRHGQTSANRERRYQGHRDVLLSSVGRDQAQRVAERLAGRSLAYCIASDLARSRETAELITAVHDVPLDLTPDLREANLGVLEGRGWDEATQLLGDDVGYLIRREVDSRAPGGESVRDVRRRVQRVHRRLTRTFEKLPEGDVLVVGHGGSLRALLAVLLRLPASAGWCFRFDNCGLTVVELDHRGQPTLRLYNDCRHLDSGVAKIG